MFHDELSQKIPELRRLRLVGRRVVLHGLGAADVVDPDDERFDVGVSRHRAEVQRDETEGNQGEENDSDFQVRVHYQRRAIELDELALGAIQRLCRNVCYSRIHSALTSEREPRTASTQSRSLQTQGRLTARYRRRTPVQGHRSSASVPAPDNVPANASTWPFPSEPRPDPAWQAWNDCLPALSREDR